MVPRLLVVWCAVLDIWASPEGWVRVKYAPANPPMVHALLAAGYWC